MDPASFLSALLSIVVIDLVLAGDNAIVIALAARNLPDAANQAIVWGTIGAIVVRTLMTVVVVWLLQVPGLLTARRPGAGVDRYRLLAARLRRQGQVRRPRPPTSGARCRRSSSPMR